MVIQTFSCGPLSTNAYIVACAETHEAAVIDPAPGSFYQTQEYVASTSLKLRNVLLTHSHWDHIADVKAFLDYYGASVSVHSLDAPNLENPGVDRIPFRLTIPGVKPDVLLEEGAEILLGELKLQVLHTPGHSPGCICFYEPAQQVLFSGDTLFKGTMGTLALPTSHPALMWPSLRKLAQLPPKTIVYPGHGAPTTIGDEAFWMKQVEQ